jgi:hypothetical protein
MPVPISTTYYQIRQSGIQEQSGAFWCDNTADDVLSDLLRNSKRTCFETQSAVGFIRIYFFIQAPGIIPIRITPTHTGHAHTAKGDIMHIARNMRTTQTDQTTTTTSSILAGGTHDCTGSTHGFWEIANDTKRQGVVRVGSQPRTPSPRPISPVQSVRSTVARGPLRITHLTGKEKAYYFLILIPGQNRPGVRARRAPHSFRNYWGGVTFY